MRATHTFLCALAWLWASGCSSDEDRPAPAATGGTKGSAQGYGGGSATNPAGGATAFGGFSSFGGVSAFGGNPSTSGECAVCKHAQDCCLALAKVQYADPDPCLTFTTNCGLFSGTAEATIIASCQAYLTRAKSNGLPECQ